MTKTNLEHYNTWYSKPENRKSKLLYLTKRRIILKDELYSILGGKRCSRCGIDDERVLQIDHINGGGTRELKKGTMYKYYIDNPIIAKSTLQVLCANCNWIKRHENNEHV